MQAKKAEKNSVQHTNEVPMDLSAQYINLPIVHPPAPNALPSIGVYLPKEIPMPYPVKQSQTLPLSAANRSKLMKIKSKGRKAPKPVDHDPYGDYRLPHYITYPAKYEPNYIPTYVPSVPDVSGTKPGY